MKLLPNGVSRTLARQVLKTKKNSPHIFFVAGIAGSVTSTVLACRATLKLDETLDEIKHDLNAEKERHQHPVHTLHSGDSPEPITPEIIDQRDYSTQMARVYVRSGLKVGKLYGPSIILGAASIGALTGSHVQLARRNATLMSAFAASMKAFEEYRLRVREEIGEEREFEVYRGISDQQIEDSKAFEKVVDPSGLSPIARCFDDANPNWQKDAERNRMFLDCQEKFANHMLTRRGHMFLNDVYDMLDMERTSIGSQVGWIYGSANEETGYINFGMYEARNKLFMQGAERSCWLDFNVQGIINDMI